MSAHVPHGAGASSRPVGRRSLRIAPRRVLLVPDECAVGPCVRVDVDLCRVAHLVEHMALQHCPAGGRLGVVASHIHARDRHAVRSYQPCGNYCVRSDLACQPRSRSTPSSTRRARAPFFAPARAATRPGPGRRSTRSRAVAPMTRSRSPGPRGGTLERPSLDTACLPARARAVLDPRPRRTSSRQSPPAASTARAPPQRHAHEGPLERAGGEHQLRV